MADGIDTLQERFAGLGEDAQCSLYFRFDPRGARQTLEPLRELRRDATIEEQALRHLRELGAPTGVYEVRLHESGRIVTQALLNVRMPEPGEPGSPGPHRPVAPGVAPAVAPGSAPAVAPGSGDFFRELGEQLAREAIAEKLSGPVEDLEEESYDDEEEEEEAVPLGERALSLAEKAMQSELLAPGLSRFFEGIGEYFAGRSRMLNARADLYEARAGRAGGGAGAGGPGGAGGGGRSTGGRAVGFRLVRTGGGGGTHGTNSSG